MKTLFAIVLLLVGAATTQAQDRIVLTNGDEIADARLFSDEGAYITYEKKKSLHDLDKQRIEFIETDSTLTSYTQDGTPLIVNKLAPKPSTVVIRSNNQVSEEFPLNGNGKPPTSVGNVASELVLGGVGGVGGALIGSLVGAGVGFAVVNDGNGLGTGAAIGASAGFVAGTALAVQAIGADHQVEANFGYTLAGATVGTAAGVLLVAAAVQTPDTYALILPALAMPAIGATIGFNMSRKYRHPETSQLNLGVTGNGVGMTFNF